MTSHRPTVALFGATGLVGGHCLRLLIERDDFSRIIVAVRRPVSPAPPDDRVRQHVVDFDHLDGHPEVVRAEAIICALGTTMRKAGSKDRFRKVDHDYPLAIARLGLREGARHFLLVSSLGADPGSRIFYNRVKGQVERDILALGYPTVTIVRPSVLLGERDEFRFGEEIAKWAMRLIPGRYRAIRAAAVARTLVTEARRVAEGVRIIESNEMRRSTA